MLCPVTPEHGHMFTTERGKFDYYCPNKHGPNAEGALVSEVLENDVWVPKVAAMIEVIGSVTKASPESTPEPPSGPLLLPEPRKRRRRAK